MNETNKDNLGDAKPEDLGPSKLPALKLYGRRESAHAYAIRDLLSRADIPFEWIELKTDEEARAVGASGLSDPNLPVCVFADGTRINAPTSLQISEKLGCYRTPKRSQYDLAIYGAGPAGLSAAVYGASEGLSTVVIERSVVGGQAGTSSKIENYLGFPGGVSGAELAHRACEQAKKFGAEILIFREGKSAQFSPGKGVGTLADGTKIIARSTICATGVSYRRLGLPDEDRFKGVGVYYGAGASEALLCANQQVIVVGGGNSAGQAAMHFSKYARKVTMVIRSSGLKETVSEYLADRILSTPQIEVLRRTQVSGLHGDDVLHSVTLTQRDTGKDQTIETAWLFLCLGGVPHTEWAIEHGIARDSDGYLVTGPDLRENGYLKNWPLERSPYYLESNLPGLFAAGDVRHGSVKRCASAVGEGAMAVTFVHRYLANG